MEVLNLIIERNFGRLFHGPTIVLWPEVAVQLVLLALDAQVKVVHGGGDLLAGVLQHFDQLTRPKLVALLEEGVSRPLPSSPSRPPNPVKNVFICLKAGCINV